MDRRARSAELAQHLSTHLWIDTEVNAAVLLKNELIELERAVADALGGVKIMKAMHVEICREAERMGRVGHAADGCIYLRIAIAAGNLDHLVEQGADLFHPIRQLPQVLKVLRHGLVLYAQRERGARQRKLLQREMWSEQHRLLLFAIAGGL